MSERTMWSIANWLMLVAICVVLMKIAYLQPTGSPDDPFTCQVVEVEP